MSRRISLAWICTYLWRSEWGLFGSCFAIRSRISCSSLSWWERSTNSLSKVKWTMSLQSNGSIRSFNHRFGGNSCELWDFLEIDESSITWSTSAFGTLDFACIALISTNSITPTRLGPWSRLWIMSFERDQRSTDKPLDVTVSSCSGTFKNCTLGSQEIGHWKISQL